MDSGVHRLRHGRPVWRARRVSDLLAVPWLACNCKRKLPLPATSRLFHLTGMSVHEYTPCGASLRIERDISAENPPLVPTCRGGDSIAVDCGHGDTMHISKASGSASGAVRCFRTLKLSRRQYRSALDGNAWQTPAGMRRMPALRHVIAWKLFSRHHSSIPCCCRSWCCPQAA